MSLKHALLIFSVLAIGRGSNDPIHARRQVYEDPFASIDKHLSHTFAYHYLWPWSQLMKAAAALDAEDSLEEPQIVSDPNMFQITLSVKRFAPDELKVKVKHHHIIVEGKHKVQNEGNRFMANHFMQRFALPHGSRAEEVRAVLKGGGILYITVPKHELPPEREVPIEFEKPVIQLKPDENSSEETKLEETVTEKREEEQTTMRPLEQLDPVESSTHIGKIRKKELKTTTKTTKDNEVTKTVDGNGLDYALIETDE